MLYIYITLLKFNKTQFFFSFFSFDGEPQLPVQG